jgi:hypothetical protein
MSNFLFDNRFCMTRNAAFYVDRLKKQAIHLVFNNNVILTQACVAPERHQLSISTLNWLWDRPSALYRESQSKEGISDKNVTGGAVLLV